MTEPEVPSSGGWSSAASKNTVPSPKGQNMKKKHRNKILSKCGTDKEIQSEQTGHPNNSIGKPNTDQRHQLA